MYLLQIKNDTEEYEASEVLLARIKALNEDSTMIGQFVVIEKREGGYMELAFLEDGKSLLLYVPESEDEAVMITCNEQVTKANSDEIRIKDIDGEAYIFGFDNVVSRDDAFDVLEAYLEGREFLSIVDWYAY